MSYEFLNERAVPYLYNCIVFFNILLKFMITFATANFKLETYE